MKTETKVLIFILISTLGGIFLFYQGIIENSQKLVILGVAFFSLSIAGWVKLYNLN